MEERTDQTATLVRIAGWVVLLAACLVTLALVGELEESSQQLAAVGQVGIPGAAFGFVLIGLGRVIDVVQSRATRGNVVDMEP
jgi:hypothetical protein